MIERAKISFENQPAMSAKTRTMYYQNEIRDVNQVPRAESERVTPEQVKLAQGLIDRMSDGGFRHIINKPPTVAIFLPPFRHKLMQRWDQRFRRSLRQVRIRLCSLYRSILLRRPNSEILEGLSPNCNSEVSQVGFTQSNEIRDQKTKTSARSVLVFIYSLLYPRFFHREKFDPPELGRVSGFKYRLIQIIRYA